MWQRPPYCPNRHPQTGGRVLVGYQHCGCAGGAGHKTAQCLRCGATYYDPPHDPQARAYTSYGGAAEEATPGDRAAWVTP